MLEKLTKLWLKYDMIAFWAHCGSHLFGVKRVWLGKGRGKGNGQDEGRQKRVWDLEGDYRVT